VSALTTRLGRLRWDLERFGLSPTKLPVRIAPGDAPKVLTISIPKSGTHLLERVLCSHPRLYRAARPTINHVNQWQKGGPKRALGRLRPGQILVSHLPFHWFWHGLAQQHGVAMVLLVRDPRAILLSEAEWAVENAGSRQYERIAAHSDLATRARMLLDGTPEFVAFADRMQRYVDWMQTAPHLVRFEALVGGRGGGDDETQRRALHELFTHIGLPLDDAGLERIRTTAFSQLSPTFRHGQTDRWRTVLPDDLQRDASTALASTLAAFGYH